MRKCIDSCGSNGVYYNFFDDLTYERVDGTMTCIPGEGTWSVGVNTILIDGVEAALGRDMYSSVMRFYVDNKFEEVVLDKEGT